MANGAPRAADAGAAAPARVLIVGTGALACLFAARLSAVGIGVTMLGTWTAGLAALQAHGVRLIDRHGTARTFPVQAVGEPALCQGFRDALVLVKAWQTARAAQQLAACLPPDGLALTLQNGWGNRERLAAALGERRVAAGAATGGATLAGPGQVRAGGEGTITVGRSPALQPLTGLLTRAGFEVAPVDDVDGLLWGKLVVNAAINPLTALLQVPNGELLARPQARQLMRLAATEAFSVGRAQGFVLPFADPSAAAEAVAQRTADNHSSMWQDVRRGAPTEIDAICGAVVAAGERLGLPVPVNRTLWLLVKAMVGEDSGQWSVTGDRHEDRYVARGAARGARPSA